MFGPILPALAAHHQVILVDLQGHGRTADIDRPLDVRLMADDIAALIDHLGLDKPDRRRLSRSAAASRSHGACKHPDKVGKLVHGLGAHPAATPIYAEMRAQQGQVNAAAEPSS